MYASAARPSPTVGSPAAASTRTRPAARPTPIGVPAAASTIRSPVRAFPGETPASPTATESASRTSTATASTTQIAVAVPLSPTVR